jgi:hypothetical protein
MTQHGADDNEATMPALPTDDEILQSWYHYASQQLGTIGSLLQILRSRQKKSEEQQRVEFEISAVDFANLQSMLVPRPYRFQYDARRIAVACHVGNAFNFIQALMLARNLAMSVQDTEEYETYEAAFDAADSDEGSAEEE